MQSNEMNREMRVIERFDGYNFLFYFIAGIKILTFFAFRFKKWKETLSRSRGQTTWLC